MKPPFRAFQHTKEQTMKKNIKSFIIGGFVASSLGALAVNIPNNFSAGQPIKAAEVNDNFTSLKAAVNALEARPSLTVPVVLTGSNTGADFGGGAVLSLKNTASGGYGLRAQSVSPQGGASNFAAIYGENTNSSATVAMGVIGSTSSGQGSGVAGFAGTGNGTTSGVLGYSYSTNAEAAGVRAEYAGSGVGTALELKNGAMRVTGAVRPAFIHTATGGSHISCIDNPLTNGDPSAIVTFSHLYSFPNDYYTVPFGLWYNGSQWCIYNEAGASQPITVGTKFSVIVFKQ
jgi:hypothetical protein